MSGPEVTGAGLAVVATLAMLGAGCSAPADAAKGAAGAVADSAAGAVADSAAGAVADSAAGAVADSAAGAAAAAAPSVQVPEGWIPLEEISDALLARLRRDAEVSGAVARAWGAPARGCYAVAVTAHRDGARLAAVVAGLRGGLGAPEAESAPATAGARAEVRLPLPEPKRGAVRVLLHDNGRATHVRAAGCVVGERYPASCGRACDAVLASLEAP